MNQGDKLYEMDSYIDEDSLLDKIKHSKAQTDMKTSTHQEIVDALQNITSAKQQQDRTTEDEYEADLSARNVLKDRRNLQEK